jgi:cytochrome c-type biogenesis protein CcmF
MLATLGSSFLFLALTAALLQGLGVFSPKHIPPQHTRRFAQACFVATAAAFFTLMYGYITSDFSLENVFQNSHTKKPLLYKISGVWGNHEGSMLLWMLILAGYGAWYARRPLTTALQHTTTALLGCINTGILLYILGVSTPFITLFPTPKQGQDLNPLLQDPALALHPPFLYLGYIGFAVPYALALAALLKRAAPTEWTTSLLRYTLAAWSFLTIGIGLGSFWAYYELGWGGWWFWDPVENASLLPWLAGLTLIHAAIITHKKQALQSWTLLLALLTFSLSLVGTFLVRSGLLTSVHSFASDPTRGLFMLVLIVLTIGTGLLIYALRAPKLARGNPVELYTPAGGMLLGNVLLITSCGTVLLGTLYPLLLEAVGNSTISVGAPYFEATFVPLMLPLLGLMALAPLLGSGRKNYLKLALATVLGGVALCLYFQPPTIMAAAGFILAAAVTFTAIFSYTKQRTLSFSLAHGGMALAIIGMITASTLQQTKTFTLEQGQSADFNGYTLTLNSIESAVIGTYQTVIAKVDVYQGTRFQATLAPEKRFYFARQMMTSEIGLYGKGLSDLYLILGESQKEADGTIKYWSFQVLYNPFIRLIWLGLLLSALGAVLGIRKRIVSQPNIL